MGRGGRHLSRPPLSFHSQHFQRRPARQAAYGCGGWHKPAARHARYRPLRLLVADRGVAGGRPFFEVARLRQRDMGVTLRTEGGRGRKDQPTGSSLVFSHGVSQCAEAPGRTDRGRAGVGSRAWVGTWKSCRATAWDFRNPTLGCMRATALVPRCFRTSRGACRTHRPRQWLVGSWARGVGNGSFVSLPRKGINVRNDFVAALLMRP